MGSRAPAIGNDVSGNLARSLAVQIRYVNMGALGRHFRSYGSSNAIARPRHEGNPGCKPPHAVLHQFRDNLNGPNLPGKATRRTRRPQHDSNKNGELPSSPSKRLVGRLLINREAAASYFKGS
jgi:hypothetical protein